MGVILTTKQGPILQVATPLPHLKVNHSHTEVVWVARHLHLWGHLFREGIPFNISVVWWECFFWFGLGCFLRWTSSACVERKKSKKYMVWMIFCDGVQCNAPTSWSWINADFLPRHKSKGICVNPKRAWVDNQNHLPLGTQMSRGHAFNLARWLVKQEILVHDRILMSWLVRIIPSSNNSHFFAEPGKKKNDVPYFPLNPGCFIGILMLLLYWFVRIIPS